MTPYSMDTRTHDDGEDIDPPMVHLVVPAAGRALPLTRAPASVFQLAERPIRTALRASMTPTPQPVLVSASIADGVKRCTGHSYPGNRWTEEKAEAERIRRAKQRPPKPTKQKRLKLRGTRWSDFGADE